ncbi:MAG: isoprenylcysteine carboxylmethyltransferase family protein [Deltaproteobacteria bacterium]|nr:isoprenylcysteine carboxylmethyltransferase family protein [Deltaproteobacteria bacterium]
MDSLRILETAYVLTLFGGYLALWRIKRAAQRRATGLDPEVFGRATDSLQRFFNTMTKVLTGAVVVIIATHAVRLDLPGVRPAPEFDLRVLDHVGLAVGMAGLVFCGIAQRTMGAAWRVGIDEEHRTELVMVGLYRGLRNPTYLGLFLVDAGLLLIWPTCSVALFVLAFYLLLEVQVRCEEQHLLRLHGDVYRDYLQSTWRYLPGVY